MAAGSPSRGQFEIMGAPVWGSAGKASWTGAEMLGRQVRGCRTGGGEDGDL